MTVFHSIYQNKCQTRIWLSHAVSLYIVSRVKQSICSHVPGGLYFYVDHRWHLLCPCPSRVQVWVSSVTEIRPEDLRAQDLDTPPEELHFMATPPSNGHLALKSAPMKAVLNFTQAHIDQGQLLFVHKGKVSFSTKQKCDHNNICIFKHSSVSVERGMEKKKTCHINRT